MKQNMKHNIIIFSICVIAVVMTAMCTGGCQEYDPKTAAASSCQHAFAAVKVRLLASFTRIQADKDAQIQAAIVLEDRFGDPVKALGEFRFELFKYRPAFSDPRGMRFAKQGIQEIDLSEVLENQKYWDSITRAYRIDLKLPEDAKGLSQIVLQVTFTTSCGERLVDMLGIRQ